MMSGTGLPAPPSGGHPDDPSGNGPCGRAGTNRDWPRWWTLPAPALLTLPVAAWCVLVSALATLCFDSCEAQSRSLNPVGVTELFLGVVSFVTLILSLFVPTWRRALRWILWITCVLAWAGGAYIWHWSSPNP